ncbi:MAG: PAS domain S-box protein, partial [Spirochaetes bacterium]|nr:PAS domain S-box protein [Spirochaetota bacterium]
MITSNFFKIIKEKIDKVDIRQLKEITEEVIREYENLDTVFNSMSEGVLVVDNDHNVVFNNKRLSSLLGITQPIIGEKLDQVINNPDLLKLILNYLVKEEKIIDVEIKLDNQYSLYSVMTIQPLVRKGKIIGNIIIINDITEKKDNEKKLKQAESLAALTTISAGIAHEIKNPLGAIGIHVQLMGQELKKCKCAWSDDISYSMNIIMEEIDRLNEIVVKFLYTVRPLKAELMLTNLKDFFDKIT